MGSCKSQKARKMDKTVGRLPSEVLTMVLAYVDPVTLGSCYSVCALWRDVIDAHVVGNKAVLATRWKRYSYQLLQSRARLLEVVCQRRSASGFDELLSIPEVSSHFGAEALKEAIVRNGDAAAIVADRLLRSPHLGLGKVSAAGWTVLHAATNMKHASVDALRRIANHRNTDPNARCNAGKTALHHAVAGGREDVVAVLLAVDRVDARATDRIGRTPLDVAKDRGLEGIVAMIAQKISAANSPEQPKKKAKRVMEATDAQEDSFPSKMPKICNDTKERPKEKKRWRIPAMIAQVGDLETKATPAEEGSLKQPTTKVNKVNTKDAQKDSVPENTRPRIVCDGAKKRVKRPRRSPRLNYRRISLSGRRQYRTRYGLRNL